jgi:hypothetical protein
VANLDPQMLSGGDQAIRRELSGARGVEKGNELKRQHRVTIVFDEDLEGLHRSDHQPTDTGAQRRRSLGAQWPTAHQLYVRKPTKITRWALRWSGCVGRRLHQPNHRTDRIPTQPPAQPRLSARPPTPDHGRREKNSDPDTASASEALLAVGFLPRSPSHQSPRRPQQLNRKRGTTLPPARQLILHLSRASLDRSHVQIPREGHVSAANIDGSLLARTML